MTVRVSRYALRFVDYWNKISCVAGKEIKAILGAGRLLRRWGRTKISVQTVFSRSSFSCKFLFNVFTYTIFLKLFKACNIFVLSGSILQLFPSLY